MRVKNLLVTEIGWWLYSNAVCVKSERTPFVIAEIEEREIEHSILEGDTSEGKCEAVSDSDSTYNLRKLNIIVL